MSNYSTSAVSASTTEFIQHVHDWSLYLCELIESSKRETDQKFASGIRKKYERQLRWLLGFIDGGNVAVQHNLLLDSLYAGQLDAAAQYNNPEPVSLEPILPCYQNRGHAFEQIEKALYCPALFFMQGPPGTGKTTAIQEIVLQALRQNPHARILIASETHVAVDNAIDRFCASMDDVMLDKVLRYPGFSRDSQLENPAAWQTELESKADRLWNQALQVSAPLTEVLWSRFMTGSARGPERRVPIWMAQNVADQCQIVGVTCNQLEHLLDEQSRPYDLAIIDECSKATLPEWLMPLSLAKKAILVGDHNQLPPTFCRAENDVLAGLTGQQEKLIRNGVIDRLFEQAPDNMKGTLLTQYRMQPNIGEFISQAFYRGQLTHGRQQTEDPQLNFGWLSYRSQVLCPDPKAPKSDQVLENLQEVAVIKQALLELSQQPGRKSCNVGIITPYKAQARAIRQMVNALPRSQLMIEVATVDAFQGRQADVIFFSFVRNNGSAKFYGDRRRVNVALSRAKDHVYLVGDRHYLKRQRRYPVLQQLANLPGLKAVT